MSRRAIAWTAALAATLVATWYAAGLDTPAEDDPAADLVADVVVERQRPSPSPAPAAQPASAEAPEPNEPAESTVVALRMEPPLADLMPAHSWQPPPPPVAAAPPAPPPSAPPLPFRYLGRLEEGAQVAVFLAEGTQTRVVRQGDRLGQYRIDDITPQGMRLTYLPLNETQRLLFGSAN
jgi:hypothetical protein